MTGARRIGTRIGEDVSYPRFPASSPRIAVCRPPTSPTSLLGLQHLSGKQPHAVHIPNYIRSPKLSIFPKFTPASHLTHQKSQLPTMNLPRQNTPSSPSPTSTSHKATMSSPLPKNYKKVVQSLIHRSDISVEVKIDLWKRFAEYQACVDEEEHLADEEEPVFVATSTKATVGKVGPDFVMPTPWMEKESSDSGEGEYNGDDGDSGYEGNGSSSVDGAEHTDGVDMMDTAEESVEEIIISSDSEGSSDQGTDSDDTSNESNNEKDSPGATLLTSEQENCTTTTTITSNTNQETQVAGNTIPTTNTSNTNQETQTAGNTTTAPTTNTTAATHATPLTPTPAPSNNLTRVRHDIRTYFSHLAARERLLCTREKWVTSRAEALWQNAEVLTGILRREFNGMGRKRVLREFEKGGERRKRVVEGCGGDGGRGKRSRRG